MTIGRVTGLAYGGDYTPEQWPETVWREDARLMREAGVNLVTVGVFAWALLEPAPGQWDFDWLDRVIDGLWAEGIHVDLATATASPPAWFVRAHPEALPVTADGVRLEFGSRQHYCPSSPAFRAATVRLATALADRYADHPALALWHVSNEYGDHVTACYCETSAAHFRRWLGERYGTLEALNHAWATTFWSQRYTAWEEIAPPRTAPGPGNPTQQLDWQRFCSDALLECYRLEADVLRERSPGVPITTNFMSLFKPLDYWTWAAEEDLVSDDAYPDPADPAAHVEAAMNFDLMRSLRGGQPWLLLEQAHSAVSWREVNVPKRPGLMRLWSLQAVAHGADGVMFFQWRQSAGGAEKFHSAMLPHGGTETRGWHETVALGRDLTALAPVRGARTHAEVALLIDWESWWGLELGEHPSQRLRLKAMALAWYRALHAAGAAVDFIHPEADLGGHRVLIAPNLYLTTARAAARLHAAVDAGASLVIGPFSGIVDRDDRLWSPPPLAELLGVRVDEPWPLPPGSPVPLAFATGERASAYDWAEWLVEPAAAEIVARYAGGGPLDSRAAITRHGGAWYVSAELDPPGRRLVVDQVLAEAGVTATAPVPAGVEATRRGSFLFLLNHGDDEARVEVRGDELLRGARVDGALTLAPLDVAVVRLEDA